MNNVSQYATSLFQSIIISLLFLPSSRIKRSLPMHPTDVEQPKQNELLYNVTQPFDSSGGRLPSSARQKQKIRFLEK
tara:strand:+ start:170 stop:400 length:231 start_codon:yes stop_codon:yes gene_type:complete